MNIKKTSKNRKQIIHIIGFPMDLGADRRGVDMGPSALRIANIEQKLEDLGYRVLDDGDIEISMPEVLKIKNHKLKYLPEIEKACEKLAQKVSSVLSKGNFPLVLGGDHSMAIGTISGVANYCKKNNKKLGVIWIDAHSDINIPETSPSGNNHVMTVAVLIGLSPKEPRKGGGDFVKLEPKNIVQICFRSVDKGEKELLKFHGVTTYTMTDIDRQGIQKVIVDAINLLKSNCDHIHVSFDLDSVDPTVVEGVGTPVSGGLTYREAHLIMETIAEKGAMNSLDIAEVNPILDIKNKSAVLASDLVASVMGKRII